MYSDDGDTVGSGDETCLTYEGQGAAEIENEEEAEVSVGNGK